MMAALLYLVRPSYHSYGFLFQTLVRHIDRRLMSVGVNWISNGVAL